MSKAEKSKRFKYRLETVLRVRHIREKQEQDKFTACQKELEEEHRKEQLLRDQQNEAYLALREIMMTIRNEADMARIQMHKAHLDRLKLQLEEQIRAREAAEKKLEMQRKVLIKAIKDRKIIERDREKTKEAWVGIMKREETKFLDDISSTRYVRNKRSV